VPPLSFSFKSALSLTAFLKVASDSFMTVSEENNYSSAGLQGVFKPESSLPDQAKLKK
jgi:hypothetical protein